MSKYILTLLLMPILSNVYADEPDPYGNNPIEYLANKDVILYAAKIGEPVSFIKYYDYFSSGISSLSEERIRKNWQEQMSQLPQKYLVIKVLRGDDIVEGDIIDTDTPKSFSTTRIGRKYILFLNRKDGGEYNYDDCNFAFIDHLNSERILSIVSLEFEQAIEYLIRERLMSCMELEINEDLQ